MIFITAASMAAVTSFCISAETPEASAALEVEFVSVAPNTGQSAGGHCGLRIGDRVYHFGLDEGRLLVTRDHWDYFLRRYRMLENRRVDLCLFDLQQSSAQQVKAHLDKLYLVQKKHLDRLAALEIERGWFEYLSGNSSAQVTLPRVGLFEKDPGKGIEEIRLRRLIASAFGSGFLASARSDVEDELRRYALEVSDVGTNLMAIDRFPSPDEIAADRLRDRLVLREALGVLLGARAVAQEAQITPDAPSLTPGERKLLEQFALQLESSIGRLLVSTRPDRGSSLLLATARYQVVHRSLAADRWIFLDTLGSDSTRFDAGETERHRDLVLAIAEQGREVWNDVRRAHSDGTSPLDLRHYNRLESSASRFIEPLNALSEKRMLRAAKGAGMLLPSRDGPIEAPAFSLAPRSVEAAVREAESNLGRYHQSLDRCYAYSLLGHNCATELVETLRTAFPSDEAAEQALGRLPTANSLSLFIPARLGVHIRKYGTLAEARSLPPFRRERIDTLLASPGAAKNAIRLRESNTLTSTVYPGSVLDNTFLFFADGAPLLRPIQGVANVGYGVINSGLGILTLPVDRGQKLKSSIKGVAYSIPELVGLPLRKGRYDMVPLSAPPDPGDKDGESRLD